MKFKIDDKIFEKFPGLNIGVVIARGINNTGENSEILELLKKQSEFIKNNFNLETLSENQKIDIWRKAYAFFGAKPKKYRCSVENLYRIILEGIELRHINKIVDIYNYISLKYIIPVGGDDIDKIDGDAALRFAKGNEPFIQLNSDKTGNPKEGEIIYADNKEVLCRRWNWRECDKTKMTEKTKNIMLVVEGLQSFSKEEVQSIINQLSDLVKKFCGGETNNYILDSDNVEIKI